MVLGVEEVVQGRRPPPGPEVERGATLRVRDQVRQGVVLVLEPGPEVRRGRPAVARVEPRRRPTAPAGPERRRPARAPPPRAPPGPAPARAPARGRGQRDVVLVRGRLRGGDVVAGAVAVVVARLAPRGRPVPLLPGQDGVAAVVADALALRPVAPVAVAQEPRPEVLALVVEAPAVHGLGVLGLLCEVRSIRRPASLRPLLPPSTRSTGLG